MNKNLLKNKISVIRLLMVFFTVLSVLATNVNYAGVANSTNLMSNAKIMLQLKESKISIEMKNRSFSEIMTEICKKGGVSYGVKKDIAIDKNLQYSISVKKQNLEETIGHFLDKTPYSFVVENNTIMIVNKEAPKEVVLAQQETILFRGKVVDEKNKPISGATVVSLNDNNGAITDSQGRFSLKVVPNSNVEISFIGYKTELVTVLSVQEKNLVIKLYTDNLEVDDVIITGMFERKEEGFTGSANTILGEELVKLSSGSILNAIEFLEPGFSMSESNASGSNPSAIPEFTMRGEANIGDYSADDAEYLRGDLESDPNQPLFVLDGIIGVNVTKIMDLDPELVECVTILKDAAACVIYGSKASNGVVVIETKKPAAGAFRVSYNSKFTVSAPDLTVYNLLNAEDKLQLEVDANLFIGTDSDALYDAYNFKQLQVLQGVDTYWLSQPLRTAFQQRHGVNLEGGDSALSYKIYLGVTENPGVMKETKLGSKNGSLSIQYRSGKFLVSNITYVDYTVTDRSSSYGSFSEYTKLNPYLTPYDENGQLVQVLEYIYTGASNDPTNVTGIMNPMYNTQTNYIDTNTAFDVRNNMKVEYRPINNMRMSLDFTISKGSSDNDKFLPSNHTSFASKNFESRGSYNWSHSTSDSFSLSSSVSYNTKFHTKDHLLSVIGRYELSGSNDVTTVANVIGFPNENMDEVFLGRTVNSISGSASQTRALSALASINYSYKSRYAADFSVRMDASSKFGSNNRFAPFWSAGLRWNIDKENFLKDSKTVNSLIFKATYGITGNDGYTSSQTKQMYTYEDMMYTYDGSDVIGTVLDGIGNPDLQWQSTNTYNLSLNFTLFNNLLTGKFEYYNKYTTNTLLNNSLAPSTGFSKIPVNMGDISNIGWESTLRIAAYKNMKKRAYVNFAVNASHNQNTIEKISDALLASNEEVLNSDDALYKAMPQYVEGYSKNMMWVVQSLGIDPMNGKEVFLKRDGTATYTYSKTDQIPLGDKDPDIEGSFTINAEYRGFSVAVGSTFQAGGYTYNQTLIDKVENADPRYNVDERAATLRWSEVGDIAAFKSIDVTTYSAKTQSSSRFAMIDNELYVGTISFRYRLEQRYNPIIKRLGISNATLGLYLEDIARFSSIKMERGTSYPFARNYTLSLNITF